MTQSKTSLCITLKALRSQKDAQYELVQVLVAHRADVSTVQLAIDAISCIDKAIEAQIQMAVDKGWDIEELDAFYSAQ